MAGNTGLYYPWIHFRDDDWVKLSLLFWRRLERIVPPHHVIDDTPVVHGFTAEGLITAVDPRDSAERIATAFGEVIVANEEDLRSRYPATELAAEEHHSSRDTIAFAPERLVHIHVAKVAWRLVEQMFGSGIAVPVRGSDPQWIGVHPEIARVYMSVLASDIASGRTSHPVSESASDLVASGGWSVETLAAALLGTPPARVGEADASPESTLAFLALRTVVPTDLASVSVDQILRVRESYGDELRHFRDSIQAVTDRTSLAEITDPGALETRLQDAYEEYVSPQLPKLRKDLNQLGLNTAEGLLGAKIVLPSVLGVGTMIASSNEVADTSAMLLGLAGIAVGARSAAQGTMAASPAAFLHRLDHELNPQPLREKVTYALQRIALGI